MGGAVVVVEVVMEVVVVGVGRRGRVPPLGSRRGFKQRPVFSGVQTSPGEGEKDYRSHGAGHQKLQHQDRSFTVLKGGSLQDKKTRL